MKIASLNGKLAWAIVGCYIQKNKSFKSVSGNSYEAKFLNNSIEYTGINRNGGMPEIIDEKEFVAAFGAIKAVGDINTNTIKDLLPRPLYRKELRLLACSFLRGF